MLQVIHSCQCSLASGRKPTYWPTDCRKKPDILDFYIVKGISANFTPVLLSISTTVIQKKRKTQIIPQTGTKFREELDQKIDLKVRLKTKDELDNLADKFIVAIGEAAKTATPVPKNEITYLLEIRNNTTTKSEKPVAHNTYTT